MRRLLLAATAIALAVPATPAQAGAGVCFAGAATVCSSAVMRCGPGDTVRVSVHGIGYGTATCGGASASCVARTGGCDDAAVATTAGGLHCTGSGIVRCEIAPGA